MSRLRRLVLSGHWFFITCRVLPWRGVLCDSEFARLARVLDERRRKHGFLLSAWVFLPNHWHALFCPPYPLTISTVMESIKVGATRRINRSRGESGVLFQGRYFDRAVRTVKEYHEKVEYIHLNPVKAGLASRPEHWPWPSVHDYTGMVKDAPATPSGLSVDRVLLPTDPRTLI
jgi:putative transposase